MTGEPPAQRSVTPAQLNAMMGELRRQRDKAMDELVTESGKRAELADALIQADAEIKRLRALVDGPPAAPPPPNQPDTIEH